MKIQLSLAKLRSIALALAVYLAVFPASQLIAISPAEDDSLAEVYAKVKAGKMSLAEFRTALNEPKPKPAAAAPGTTVPAAKTGPVTDKNPVAASTPTPKPEKIPIDEFEDYVGIRKSFLAQNDEAEPAKLSWTKNLGEPSYYTLDVAVRLQGKSGLNGKPGKGFTFLEQTTDAGEGKLYWKIEPTFEAHVSNQEKNAQDSLSARLPITLTWLPGDPGVLGGDTYNPSEGKTSLPLITQWFLTVSPVYEFDRLLNNETIGGDLFLTANAPSLYIGSFAPLTPRATVSNDRSGGLLFNWRPYLGFEGGHVLASQKGSDLDESTEYARFSAKVHADLAYVHRRRVLDPDKLNFPKQFSLSIDYYFRQDFEGSQTAHSYVEASSIYYLDYDEHFSLGLTYKRGETTPKFAQVDSFNAWIGIKY